MEALFLLIPLSILALGVAIVIFLRMNASGQFDDTEGPAWRILLDDDSPPTTPDEEAQTDDSAAVTRNRGQST